MEVHTTIVNLIFFIDAQVTHWRKDNTSTNGAGQTGSLHETWHFISHTTQESIPNGSISETTIGQNIGYV